MVELVETMRDSYIVASEESYIVISEESEVKEHYGAQACTT